MKNRQLKVLAIFLFLIGCSASNDEPPPSNFKLSSEVGGFELTKLNFTKYGIPY